MFLAATTVFYESFLKDFGVALDINGEWGEFQVEKTKVVRKIMTITHYFFLQRLVSCYSSNNNGKIPTGQEFFEYFENFVAQLTKKKNNDLDFSIPINKEKFESQLKLLDSVIGKIKKKMMDNTVDELKLELKGGLITGTKPILTARIIMKTETPNFEPEYWNHPDIVALIEGCDKKTLISLLYVIGVKNCAKGSKEMLKETFFSLSEKKEMTKEQDEVMLMYAFFRNFSLPCVMLHRAIRTGYFEEFVTVMKMSLKMWQMADKTKYWGITTKHLFDLHYRFPDFHLAVYKQLWVINCKTTSTNIGIDENNEFVNKFIKEHLRLPTAAKLQFFSANYNLLHDLSEIWTNMFNCRKENTGKKSKDIKFENLARLQKNIQDKLKMPSGLLRMYNTEVADEIFLQEQVKILGLLGLEKKD